MANINSENKDLVSKAQTTALSKPGDDLISMINKSKNQIMMALPKHIGIDQFMRAAMTAVRKSTDIQKCNPMSFLCSLLTASQLGLKVNSPTGEAYLVPYKNECTLVIGYKGYQKLAANANDLRCIYAEVIREKDEWEITLGLNRTIKHKPNLLGTDRGKMIIAYAVAVFKDGTEVFDFMPAEDIIKRKKVSKTAKSEYSPWNNWEEEMWKKTVIKHLCSKYLELSEDVLNMISTDENVKSGIQQNMLNEGDDFIITKSEIVENEEETKEIELQSEIKTEPTTQESAPTATEKTTITETKKPQRGGPGF